MKNRREIGFGGSLTCGVYPVLLYLFLLFFVFTSFVSADLGPENVLLLVNEDSATSQYISEMYRQYYPAIQDNQVLLLSGLVDCSGPTSTPADEIITRQQYDTLIADPVRQHLLNNNFIQQITVIVTTAGMPYRIEDTNHGSVVDPAASSYSIVEQYLGDINAASVESELTCLWYADTFGLANRMVNPYQGYQQSSITLFERVQPNSKPMHWETAINITGTPPKMEGYIVNEWPTITYGTIDRSFHAGDMYLTCRLDGPKNQGKSAVFAVRQMLERAKRVSSPYSGVNPAQAVVVIDDAPSKDTDRNRVYNLKKMVNFWVYDPVQNQPPDAPTILTKDDYQDCYTSLTNDPIVPNGVSLGMVDMAGGTCTLFDQRAGVRTNQSDLDLLLTIPELGRQGPQGLLAFVCYGKYNGDETITKEYLLTGGPNGGALFNPVNGAVFTSIESFNGVSFFSDAVTTQAKIIDFVSIGGAGAIGHAFEPVSDAIVDNLFFIYNYLADEDADGFADLSFVEAAWTGIPYISWSEVVIGDPLMRVAYGLGEDQAWTQFPGDVNGDDRVNIFDIAIIRGKNGGLLYSDNPLLRDKYSDLCDLNNDGRINIFDIAIVRSLNGTIK
ncbi:MAG: hypothetical protein H8E62_07180 [Planctomycetes bacterium]|nr:hypothetical protein [Planctomycetota bacterium]